MLFNSFEFFLFFPIVTIIYFLLPFPYRWIHLLLASCVFYCAFIPAYILILFFTIAVDYIAGIAIENAEGSRRKLFLILSIAANAGVLAFFKYYNFFTENINLVLHGLQINRHELPYLDIILPIGLSFHTFQAMSYTIEVYRGRQQAERHLGIYALYVLYYPQLVAGPIERPQQLLHQLKAEHPFKYEKVVGGLRLMLWGMFKKVVIADNLGLFTDQVFNAPSRYRGTILLIAMLFYAFQIYCDFSGYSDIAIGASRVMGIDLMKNFDRPFISKNITEFWRRWHISLSTWFNDYLFTPLVIARRDWGKTAVVFALFVTFFISGLWHGAGWTFIIWGLLHGIAVGFEFLTKKSRLKVAKKIPPTIYNTGSLLLTFVFLCIAWVFFRAISVRDAIYILSHCLDHTISGTNILTQLDSLGVSIQRLFFLFALLSFLLLSEKLVIAKGLDAWIGKKPAVVRWSIYYLLVILMINVGVWGEKQFIYFQF